MSGGDYPEVGTARRAVRENQGCGDPAWPIRKRLPHAVPSWVETGAVFFVTICLDQRGSDRLCRHGLPMHLWESVLYRAAAGQWWPHLFLVMPDHVHALLSFALAPGIKKTTSEWKRFSAHKFGIEWQRDFFDHRLRNDEALVEKAHYIRMNPVRAGLVGKPEDWPHVWTVHGALGESALPKEFPRL